MENNDQNDKKKATQKAGGLLFTGCMFIGMALGWFYGNLNVGLFGGMGVGFVMMAIILLSNAAKKP